MNAKALQAEFQESLLRGLYLFMKGRGSPAFDELEDLMKERAANLAAAYAQRTVQEADSMEDLASEFEAEARRIRLVIQTERARL